MPNFERKESGSPEFEPGSKAKEIQKLHDKAVARALEDRVAPPRITEPRCHTCNSSYREWIEWQLTQGHSYLSIERALPQEDKVDRRSISKHAKEHMAVTQAAYRAILEEESDLEAQNFEEGVKGAITSRGVLEILIRTGFQDVLEGNAIVEPKDLIQIVKLKMEMDSQHASVQVEEYKRQVSIFTQAIQNVVTPDIQGEIVAEIKKLRRRENDPTAYERELAPPQITEAQVVDESV